ncbi:28S ribosomal protein S21, mitochondrial [Neolamprologus brichardi]|uniref:28S ribosomal protein S21, mitochondrial n=1 Tax=Neolamprologus brichardi TaxID=32507 RepID=UPI0003EBB7C6|nr:28S ribosomal protein S21, mitochondrial [Neolamprologus brichardi]
MARHLRFISRLLSLIYSHVFSVYSRILTQDGIVDTVKRKRYYEKPCRERQRKNFENCRRIYHTEMARKIAFISRTNREDPWLGC